MASYFEATPKVVTTRPKYNPAEQAPLSYDQFMEDDKVKLLNPAHQEREFLK